MSFQTRKTFIRLGNTHSDIFNKNMRFLRAFWSCTESSATEAQFKAQKDSKDIVKIDIVSIIKWWAIDEF